MRELLVNGIDWHKVVEYALRNKVLYLIIKNLKRYGCYDFVPEYLKILIDDSVRCNIIRNNLKFSELQNLCSIMEDRGVVIVPVKGAYMIDHVYKDRSARATNDMDALILKKDIPQVNKIMRELDYTTDKYDKETNKLVKRTTAQHMLYKTKMYNLLPYVKLISDPIDMQMIFDFSHALDFSLDAKPVQEMIESSYLDGKIRKLLPEHFFVHMCCHHYREASHVEWLRIGQDLNLIKFCDIREFIINELTDTQMEKAISFSKKHNVEKAVYFVLHFLNIIYCDGYEERWMQQLEIKNDDYVYMFGESEGQKVLTRQKEFWDSFFDINNSDEIISKPHYDDIV